MRYYPDDPVWRLWGKWVQGFRARYRVWFLWAMLTLAFAALAIPANAALWMWAGLSALAAPVAGFATGAVMAAVAAQSICHMAAPHYSAITPTGHWIEQAIEFAREPRPAAAPVDVHMPQPTRPRRVAEFNPAMPAHARRSPHDCDHTCPGRRDDAEPGPLRAVR